MSSTLKTLLLWTVIFLVVILLWSTFQAGRVTRHELSFSEFLDNVSSGRVKEVTVRGQEVHGTFKRGGAYPEGDEFTVLVPDYPQLTDKLLQSGVAIKVEKLGDNPILSILIGWAPVLIIVGLWIFFMRQMQSGGNKALSFGKSEGEAALLDVARR